MPMYLSSIGKIKTLSKPTRIQINGGFSAKLVPKMVACNFLKKVLTRHHFFYYPQDCLNSSGTEKNIHPERQCGQ